MHKYLLLLLYILPIVVFAVPSSPVVRVDVDPHYIRANQPFTLIFYYEYDGARPLAKDGRKINIPNELTILNGPIDNLSTSSIWIDKKTTLTDKVTCKYILVANKTGDFAIPPMVLTFNTGEVFTSDSFWIHIYEDRISSADSLEKLNLARYPPIKTSSFWRDMIDSSTLLKSEGYYFNHKDSIYSAQVGEAFDIVYSISQISKQGLSSFRPPDIRMSPYFPELLRLKYLRSRSNVRTLMRGNTLEFRKDFIVTVMPKIKGKIIIPSIEFGIDNGFCDSPEVTVVVKK